MKGKRGRPRKDAARFPCGRIIDRIAPTPEMIRHRAESVGKGQVGSPQSGYFLGVLRLKAMISERQHDAGVAYLRCYILWSLAEEIPRRTPVVRAAGRGLCVLTEPAAQGVIARFDGAWQALARCGLPVCATVNAVVIDEGRVVTAEHLDALRQGLDALATYFRLPQEGSGKQP